MRNISGGLHTQHQWVSSNGVHGSWSQSDKAHSLGFTEHKIEVGLLYYY